MADWQYVFCDLATGAKKATLPMYDVSFDQKLCDVGQLEGTVPTVDPVVRAQDPWAATEPRRTAVYVECDNDVVWGGIVQGVERDQDTWGLKLTAWTYESWLAQQYLTANFDFRIGSMWTGESGVGPNAVFNNLIWDVTQTFPNNSIGMQVAPATYLEDPVNGALWQAAACKSIADLLKGWVTEEGHPIEWRVDVTRSDAGVYTPTLTVTGQTLATGRPVVGLQWPAPANGAGGLLTFTDTRDGSAEANAMVGGAQGAGGVNLFSFKTATDVGSDEFARGYPMQMATYSVGGSNITQAVLDAWVEGKLLDALVQGHALSNVTLLADALPLASYAVGDAVNVGITHPAYKEWPAPAAYDGFRILGRKVTVGSGTTPDTVSLDLVPPADRLPESVHLTATLRKLLGRINSLETGIH